ncbi:MAG: YfhO family protein [Desulfobacteraceae bacterium]|nr:YfhO family protein [Desulfobacteraceae bacterium]
MICMLGEFFRQFVVGCGAYAGDLEWILPVWNQLLHCDAIVAFSDRNIVLQKWEQVAYEPEIRHLQLKPNSLELRIVTQQKGLLIWADAWDEGWKVEVNGESSELKRILGILKAVNVPKGESHVKFTYRPVYLTLGIFMFLLGLTAIVVIARIMIVSYRNDRLKPMKFNKPTECNRRDI